MTDIRDGEPVTMTLPQGVQAFRQPSGEIALWDGERHALIGSKGQGKKAALWNLECAGRHARGEPIYSAETEELMRKARWGDVPRGQHYLPTR